MAGIIRKVEPFPTPVVTNRIRNIVRNPAKLRAST